MKEELEFTDEFPQSPEENKNDILPNQTSNELNQTSIRPRPLICKPSKVNVTDCKSEPINAKRNWAPGAWQDATRTSAFQPYKPPTLLTNLQRGNTQTEILLPRGSDITFYTLAGQGELTEENIVPAIIDIPDENGLTALMWAAGYGQLSSARLLLKNGADKNHKGSHGQTPLHLAAAFGHHDLVKLLLNHGADPNASEEDGNTPLIYGAQGDHPHVCHELLTRGADITARNVHGVSAYKAAVLKKSVTAKAVIENFLVQKLVKSSPDIF